MSTELEKQIFELSGELDELKYKISEALRLLNEYKIEDAIQVLEVSE